MSAKKTAKSATTVKAGASAKRANLRSGGAVTKSKKSATVASASPETTKQSLMDAAIRLFAEKGYDATTVKDISDRAGVNVSLVSYHFEGKEGLYRTCLATFGAHRLESAKRILQPPTTLEECRVRFEMFIEDMMVWWEEQPNLCKIIQRESHLSFPVAKDVFENSFLKIFETFVSFIKSGQQKKFIRADVDMWMIGGVIFGGLVSSMEKDELSTKYFGYSTKDAGFRKKMKEQISKLFFQGVQA